MAGVSTATVSRCFNSPERVVEATRKKILLIVDELGYLSFSRSGAELLFQVFADRYERRSLLITSNLAFSDWGQIFQGERMTAALLDRLTHHCHIFEMNGESYRFKESMKQKAGKRPPKPSAGFIKFARRQPGQGKQPWKIGCPSNTSDAYGSSSGHRGRSPRGPKHCLVLAAKTSLFHADGRPAGRLRVALKVRPLAKAPPARRCFDHVGARKVLPLCVAAKLASPADCAQP